MKQLSCMICILSLTSILTFAQIDKRNWLTGKIKSADSILLISHELVAGSTDNVVDKKGNEVALPELIIDNKLNRAIVKEEKVIKDKAVDNMIKILARPNKSSVISQGGCFVPRQSIIIIKDSQISYIDLCFHYSNYETSKDLKNITAFDNKRWTKLEKYFKQQGLTYELD